MRNVFLDLTHKHVFVFIVVIKCRSWQQSHSKHTDETLASLLYIMCTAHMGDAKKRVGVCASLYRCVCVFLNQNVLSSTNHRSSCQHDQIRTSGLEWVRREKEGFFKMGVVRRRRVLSWYALLKCRISNSMHDLKDCVCYSHLVLLMGVPYYEIWVMVNSHPFCEEHWGCS